MVLTTVRAAKQLAYIAREEAAGRLTPNLEGIRVHRQAFLARSNACERCGRVVTDPDSLQQWQTDHLGPDCREITARALA